MSLMTLSSVSKFFGADLILDSVSFRVERGDRVALVGTNGSGKSTILRIMAGEEEPDAGTVSRAHNLRVVYLPQDPEFCEEDTLYQAMLDAFHEVIAAQERLSVLEKEMAGGARDPSLIDEYGHLQSLVEHVGYDYHDQIGRVLAGLGLAEETWNRPVSTLSGGQRTRANLARTLLEDGDLLLLDEPTNHLDIAAVEWLETYLADLKRAFVMVAHDRYLLDRVTRRTIELSFHKVEEYDAPYSRFLDLKAERMERRRLEYEAQQEHIAKTEDYIRRYGAGQRSREARGRQKRLDRLERIERPREESTVHLQLSRPKRSGDLVLEIQDLVAGYPNKPLVRLPDEVAVRRGERIAVIGANGSGKTTLLRTVVGQLPPIEGTLRWGAKTSIGYYSQTLGQLDENLTVIEEVQRSRPMSEEEARTYLGQFLFSGDDVFKRVSVLSGGERSRVALAKLVLDDPNVLVLDEPTNHLDIASRDALQRVLNGFHGTLLFVSHDRYLIDALAIELWAITSGTLARFAGTYTEYAAGRARKLDRDEVQPPNTRARTQGPPEEQVRVLTDEAESLAARLAETAPTTALAQLIELTDQYDEIQRSLEEAQHAWLRSVKDQLRASSG